MLRPERWWTMLGHGEARRNLGGSLRCAELTCKSLPPDLSIGAKDSSNHLVAGSLRSFPQDSSNPQWVARGKAMKGGICGSSSHDLGLLSNFKSLRLVCLSWSKTANFLCFFLNLSVSLHFQMQHSWIQVNTYDLSPSHFAFTCSELLVDKKKLFMFSYFFLFSILCLSLIRSCVW